MALNKFSVLVSNVGTSGTIGKVAKCFFFCSHSRIMRRGEERRGEERRMGNKPHFSSPGLEFKEKVSITSLGNEKLLRDICQVPSSLASQLDSGSVVTSCGGTEQG